LEAIPGVAAGTSALAVVYNVDLHHRRRSPESQLAADPLHPPLPQASRVDDDDDHPPLDLDLIARPTLARTASVSLTR
jgi:hypothetical protein